MREGGSCREAMDLPDTLEGVLRAIVAECVGEYERILREADRGAMSAADVAQASITMLVAQKDLLTYLESKQRRP